MLRYEEKVEGIEIKDIMVGNEVRTRHTSAPFLRSFSKASAARKLLKLSYPIENGIVKDWEDIAHVWDYTFSTASIVVNATSS